MTEVEIVKGLLALWLRECQKTRVGSRPGSTLRAIVTITMSRMRTIGFRSNILFAIAAAFGVIAALGRPWYGPPGKATDAQMEDVLASFGRAFTAIRRDQRLGRAADRGSAARGRWPWGRPSCCC